MLEDIEMQPQPDRICNPWTTILGSEQVMKDLAKKGISEADIKEMDLDQLGEVIDMMLED